MRAAKEYRVTIGKFVNIATILQVNQETEVEEFQGDEEELDLFFDF